MALVSGIYSHVPQGSVYPYLIIGDGEVRPMNTVDVPGAEYRVEVVCYSRGRGHKEGQDIMARAHAVLTGGALSVSGGTVINARFLGAEAVLERDGVTYRTAGRFAITVQG